MINVDIKYPLIFLLIFLASCKEERPRPVLKPVVKKVVDEPNGGLVFPDGFEAVVVAEGVGPARHLAVNDNGDIYVKLRTKGILPGSVALRDTDNDGKADLIKEFGNYPNDGTFATEMRIHNGYLYFSTERVVYRQKLTPPKLVPDGKPEVIVVDRYPIRWHNAKSLAFDNKGSMYVTFSAPTNACENWKSVKGEDFAGVKGFSPCPELKEFGGVWKFDESKPNQFQKDGQRFATGLRSIVAIEWNEEDNNLYAVNHGRDYLEPHAPESYSKWDNAVLPAEEFMKIKEGEDYGWPYTYYDSFKKKRMLAPEYGGDGIKEAKGYADPIMGFPAHWAPNDLLFYKGDQFPARYKGGAFVAFHGSTNRGPYPQGGYIVAFTPFENGKPSGDWEVFADGFIGKDKITEMKEAKYRPMGLAEGPNGSLYIAESRKGKIWKVSFKADSSTFGDTQLAKMELRKSRSYIKIPDEKADIITPK